MRDVDVSFKLLVYPLHPNLFYRNCRNMIEKNYRNLGDYFWTHPYLCIVTVQNGRVTRGNVRYFFWQKYVYIYRYMLGFIAVNIGVVNFKSEYLSWWYRMGIVFLSHNLLWYSQNPIWQQVSRRCQGRKCGGVFCSSKVCLPHVFVFCFLLWE